MVRHRQPEVSGCAFVDGAPGRALARSAGTARRLSLGKAALALAREADLEWLMIDSTIVRARQHAAGVRKKKGERMPRAGVGLAVD